MVGALAPAILWPGMGLGDNQSGMIYRILETAVNGIIRSCQRYTESSIVEGTMEGVPWNQ